MPVTGIGSWREADGVRPVAPAAAAPPSARTSSGHRTIEEPIDVEVLWEELEAALRATPAEPDITPLAPVPAAVAGAYAAAMRRTPRPPRVDVAVL